MPLGGLLTAGLIVGGAGLLSKGVAGVKTAKGAKKLDALGREIPQAEQSKYIPQLIGATQTNINANPLMAASQRRNQTQAANSIYQARQVGDPSQLMGLIAGIQGQSAENDLKAQMGDEQLREQRRGAYYNALQAGAQEEQNFFDRRMANVQTRGNLLQAATKQKAEVWNSMGSDLIGMGGSLVSAGMYNKK
jgi:hypothetical protein